MGRNIFLDSATAAPDEAPVLSVRRHFFFRRGYHVVATWPNGKRKQLAHFQQRECADYWLEVEGPHWLRHPAWPVALTRMGIQPG